MKKQKLNEKENMANWRKKKGNERTYQREWIKINEKMKNVSIDFFGGEK